jgi:hypothetical protein
LITLGNGPTGSGVARRHRYRLGLRSQAPCPGLWLDQQPNGRRTCGAMRVGAGTLAEGSERPRPVRHAASANCRAISLFTRCTVPLPTPTIAATLRMPLPALRCSRMAVSTFGATLGRPCFFPCWRTRSSPAFTLLRMISRSHRRHLDHGSFHRHGYPASSFNARHSHHHHRQRYCRPMRGNNTIPGHQGRCSGALASLGFATAARVQQR